MSYFFFSRSFPVFGVGEDPRGGGALRYVGSGALPFNTNKLPYILSDVFRESPVPTEQLASGEKVTMSMYQVCFSLLIS